MKFIGTCRPDKLTCTILELFDVNDGAGEQSQEETEIQEQRLYSL